MSTPTRRPLTAFGSLRQRVVGHRQWSDEDRAAIVGSLFPRPAATAEFVLRFLTLMVLSTVIAALGLMSNSAAVVIGAMLVAPLMTPILGVAFSVMMGNPNRFLGSLALIGAGVVVAIGAAAAVSALAPGTVTADELSGELLARTAPTLLDLGIAVAAGLAAGYVLTHPLASSSLPGVAIAVALVPPLATVGIAFQLGATDAAEGAFLLFSTNLLAIVLSAMVVALLSGIASLRGPGAGERGVRSGLVITGAMLVVVAVPLTVHTIDVVEDRNFTRQVIGAIDEWDPNSELVELDAEVAADGVGRLDLVMATRNEPIPAWRLAEILTTRTGRAVSVDVQYIVETVDSAVAE